MPDVTISFLVIGLPKAQPRPRAFYNKHLGQARVFEAGTAESWKGNVALAAREHRPATTHEGPVVLEIDILLPRPKRLNRKADPDGKIPCIAKPDWDNLGKAISDAITPLGIWRDDCQVCDARVRKWYVAKPGQTFDALPGARITITLQDGANQP
jgi:Holliday junction resolvase RusA-like endonuclease